MTNPTVEPPSGLDLDKIRGEYLRKCGPHDFGLVEYGCNCPSGEPRWAIQRLADEVEALRAALAAAEQRGRQWAIDALRDDSAYWEHQRKTGEYDGGRHFIADWLESVVSTSGDECSNG